MSGKLSFNVEIQSRLQQTDSLSDELQTWTRSLKALRRLTLQSTGMRLPFVWLRHLALVSTFTGVWKWLLSSRRVLYTFNSALVKFNFARLERRGARNREREGRTRTERDGSMTSPRGVEKSTTLHPHQRRRRHRSIDAEKTLHSQVDS